MLTLVAVGVFVWMGATGRLDAGVESTPTRATYDAIQLGASSPSGDWRLGETAADGIVEIESRDGADLVTHQLVLPRLSDLKFVGWGPQGVDGAAVLWVYSADIGSLLYAVTDSGVTRLACPSELSPPAGWPGEARITCGAP